MFCPKCGKKAPKETNFCARCGHRIPRFCPECGYASVDGSNTCPGCGHDLSKDSGERIPGEEASEQETFEDASVQTREEPEEFDGLKCDLCEGDFFEEDLTPVLPDEIAFIAENGYGEYIDHWSELSLRERIARLITLSREYDTPWMLCPDCYEDTRPFAPKSTEEPEDLEAAQEPDRFCTCDLCGTETPELDSTAVSQGLMRVLAEEGYGEFIDPWRDLSPEERREKLFKVTSSYETPWVLCPTCLQSARAFARERDFEETEEERAAVSTTQKEELSGFRRAVRIMGRVLLFCISLILLLYGIGHLAGCNQTLTPPSLNLRPGHGLTSYMDPRNGLHLSLGLVLVSLGLLTLNASFRRATGRGPVDWILGFATILIELAASQILLLWEDMRDAIRGYMVVVFLLGILAFGIILWFVHGYHYHFDPKDAAQAFASQVDESTLTNSSNTLFGRGKEGGTHIAPMTPTLIRALEKRNVQIGGYQARQRELAVPGILPILFLAALVVFSLGWNLFKRPYLSRADQIEAEAHHHARVTLFFGLISLYVMLWLAFGQMGNEMQIFGKPLKFPERSWETLFGPQTTDPARQSLESVFGAFQNTVASKRLAEWIFWAVLLVTAGIAMMAFVYFKLDRPELPEQSRTGWGSLYFLVHLGAIAGIFVVSFKSPGTPVLFWVIGYVALGLLLWFISRPEEQV